MLALAPLALAGLLTLATCVAIGLPLNLANIIALPLLFAQGVAFDIYYVAAWRGGERALLPSALTRAVLYSALTNGTAFGTLALSQHPGMAGMGVMLTDEPAVCAGGGDADPAAAAGAVCGPDRVRAVARELIW